jgi:threonine synthase
MKFYSTKHSSPLVNFKEALMAGLAPDGGLFVPEYFPRLKKKFIENISKKDFQEIALEVSKKYITDIPEKDLKKIIRDAFNPDSFRVVAGFPAPLIKLADNLYILELWHGPTLAFKDFGARFMARTMNYYLHKKKKKLNIVVATSGDTGSAVAQGFYGLSNIKVFVLYPSKRITKLQEKQMAALGGNIVALEVKGNFDDCQHMAKQLLADEELKSKIILSSANSINFGRLLPQSFYYFWGYAQLKNLQLTTKNLQPVFCVPSGNFGNLTAGLMAKRMGLSAEQFIAATNANDVIPQYLKTGKFVSRVSHKTISNAMDVGNPNNFARMSEMFHGNVKQMRREILGVSISDKQTRETIKNVFRETKYVVDPHTAVGIAAATRELRERSSRRMTATRELRERSSRRMTARKSGIQELIVVLSTAHPVKFREIVEPVIGRKIVLPRQLKSVMRKKKKSILMKNDLEDIKKIILLNVFSHPPKFPAD